MRPVSVPATTANLGGAFDCAALALGLHLVVEPELRAGGGFELVQEGPELTDLPADGSNLVQRSIARMAAWAGTAVPGLRLTMRNEIPVGAGLGSSAAAIVAGLLIGAQLAPLCPDDSTLLGLALELEGHPDNVAAAYLGGLVVTAPTSPGGEVLSRKATVPDDLAFIAAVPRLSMPTAQARALLAPSFSREDAVYNLQRTALLVASAFSGEFDFVPQLFADRWHQDRRSAALPGLRRCLQLRHPDLLGIFLSGAGPSVLAVARRSTAEISELMLDCFRAVGVEARALVLRADNRGAKGRFQGGQS